VELAAAVVPSVAIVAGCSLRALAMFLAHKEKKLLHAPIAHLEQKMTDLENRLLSRAMGR
jgi:outer membrane murein-binding lipoprotein Lpp